MAKTLGTTVILAIVLCLTARLQAGKPPLLPEAVIAALAQELSGETAKRNLEYLTRLHRMRGSRQFRAAAEHIAGQLREYGLTDVRIEKLPADGTTFYGTQKSRPAWDAEFAELWELRESETEWTEHARVASFDAMPITLAQDSESGEVTADLVDVGQGTSESDYTDRDVRGKLVLASAQPGEVAELAVARHGAAGILSYAQNQRTAWWGEDENLVRWGHLDSFATARTFAFMLSLKQARALHERLRNGERVRLRASVTAGRHPGFYEIVTATIPGAAPALRDQEIVFSCHLDHQRPGANDNASGCVTILEVARTIATLVRQGRIPPPARTLRFVWPPEIEGTVALLNARPQIAGRARAAIHMDMVGGGPETKAIFHVTRGPASLPSFVYDVAETFGAFVNEQSASFASTGRSAFALHAPEGGREALLAEMVEFTTGSDHQVYTDSSFGIPAVYLNDWPDRYIHTNRDAAANIDPTKLKRAGFIGAATALVLADLTGKDAAAVWHQVKASALRRAATALERSAELPAPEGTNLLRFQLSYERAVVDSMERFLETPPEVKADAEQWLTALASTLGMGAMPARAPSKTPGEIYRRSEQPKGPLSVFGYDYFVDRYGSDRARRVRLLEYQGARGSGAEYAYEALNFVDGRRSVQEIRDAVSAVYGPVPIEVVEEYLRALESIDVIEAVK